MATDALKQKPDVESSVEFKIEMTKYVPVGSVVVQLLERSIHSGETEHEIKLITLPRSGVGFLDHNGFAPTWTARIGRRRFLGPTSSGPFGLASDALPEATNSVSTLSMIWALSRRVPTEGAK